MGRVISVHSFKGGTGKTVILTNLAAIFANKGLDVCLLDMDLRAPSLGITFERDTEKRTINDLLDGRCELEDVIFDVRERYATKGRFLVGLADQSPEAIQRIITKSRKWEMKSLQRIISLRKVLVSDMGMDYVLFDTSPGVQYSSINAISNADVILTVSVFDDSDISGTKGLINSIYDLLEKETYVVMNKIPLDFLVSEAAKKKLLDEIHKSLNKPIISTIPCYCDVLQSNRKKIFVLEYPQHGFTSSLYELSEMIT
jgi:septum site-determining protein MinD